MRRAVLALAALLAAPAPLGATSPAAATEAPWKRELVRDLVRAEAGRWLVEETDRCRIDPPPPPEPEAGAATGDPGPAAPAAAPRVFHVRTRSEATPPDFISRDQFVALTAQISMSYVLALATTTPGVDPAAALAGLRCTPAAAPGGAADFELRAYMTPGGVIVDTLETESGRRGRHVETWRELMVE